MSALLELAHLTTGYRVFRRQSRIVTQGISVTVQPGELVCLLGQNGAGKSTLLRTVAGAQAPLAGHVRLSRQSLHRMSRSARARTLAMVLTDRVDVGLLTAHDVVCLGRYPYTGWAAALSPLDLEVVGDALETVGASHLAQRPMTQLSDGERQRVMIARALAQQPRVLLLDEPTAFLDAPRRVEVFALLRRLAQEQHIGIVVSTHEVELALQASEQVWLLRESEPLVAGTAEAVIQQGLIQQTFCPPGVTFDPVARRFDVSWS